LSIIQNLEFESVNSSKVITTIKEDVRSKIIQQTINGNFIKKNPPQIRFSQKYSQNKIEGKAASEIKPKLDRAQSSGSFFIPKLKLNELIQKKGV
jgi:predicted nucleotidyltransferase